MLPIVFLNLVLYFLLPDITTEVTSTAITQKYFKRSEVSISSLGRMQLSSVNHLKLVIA